MSKAVQGAVELAGAAVLFVAMDVATGGLGAFVNTPAMFALMSSLAAGGVAMEAGAIADALSANRGENITIRQAAGARQYVYGTQRIGGNLVYPSTTGSHVDQFNNVIALAGRPLDAIEALYLDGRKVNFVVGSAGNTTRNGVNFGGNADNNIYTGPDGVQYNFGGGSGGTHVYCEARFGDQSPGDVIGGLTANDPHWAADSAGSPYLGGCAYVYLKEQYDTSVFPTRPEVRFTVRGHHVYDPRTGLTAYSSNAALICADWWLYSGLGLQVNQAQLIVAANVCDEQVALASGRTEARYACHYHFDTSSPPSDIFVALLKSMGGRHSEIGGELFLFPSTWVGPSFNWDDGIHTAGMQWDPTSGFAESCNRVNGTYTAANYPYNIAGNLYDSNGYDSSGNIQNNFQFGFMPDSFPQYACDPYHGFAADEFLNRDSGVTAAFDPGVSFALGQVVSYTRTIAGKSYASVWRSKGAGNIGNTPGPTSTYWTNAAVELSLQVDYPMVLSISQAQRLAKIELMRRRYWGTGTFEIGLAGLAMQNCDVMQVSSATLGWTNKLLEMTSCTFRVITREGQPDQPPPPPECRLLINVRETDPGIFAWSVVEEQNVYGVPVLPPQQNRVPAPPTSMTLTSSAATAITSPDGSVSPRIQVGWQSPLDVYVSQIQIQYQRVGDVAWTNGLLVDVALSSGYISQVVAGAAYNVRIRSLRSNGALSVWAEIDNFTSGLTVNSQGQTGVGIGTLVTESYSSGAASITCNPFPALVGQLSLSIFPAGPVVVSHDGTIGGSGATLAQQVLYYIYYVDLATAGGNVTPIATTNRADFLGKQGYFLIDSVVTRFMSASGGGGGGAAGTRYYPSTFSDVGSRSTSNGSAAYDGTLSSYALVSGQATSTTDSNGDCIFQGDPSYALPTASTLNVVASVSMTGLTLPPGNATITARGNATITACVNGTSTALLLATANTSTATYTCSVPAGTPLSTVLVECVATPNSPTTLHPNTVNIQVYEIFIQS